MSTNDAQEVSILNEFDELITISFSSDEMLETVQEEDSTVEVVGFVDEIEGPKLVGKDQQYTLLKFLLNNNRRHRLQVVAWNEEADRIKNFLQPNKIIHVDGAKAKKPKTKDFNRGTLPFELIIRSNTIVNNLGVFDIKKNIQMVQAPKIEFSSVPKYLNQCILIHGFIKTSFNVFTNNNKKMYTYGSITDGCHKLEIQINNFENNNDFAKGEQIEVKGYVKIMNNIYYIEVEKESDLKLLEGRTLTFAECLRGTKPIKRVLNDVDGETELPNKNIRKS